MPTMSNGIPEVRQSQGNVNNLSPLEVKLSQLGATVAMQGPT